MGLLRDASGQAAVELAVVLPVILILMVIVVDAMVFISACSEFDQLAPQAILACATSPESGTYDSASAAGQIKSRLEESLSRDKVSIDVSVSERADTLEYKCTLSMEPWPLASGKSTFLGMRIPKLLSHETSLCVSPYEVGAVG